MNKYYCSFGRINEIKHEHPERNAMKSGMGIFADYTFQVFPNRQSMAKCIRLQQKRASRPDDWKAIVPLTDGEGY